MSKKLTTFLLLLVLSISTSQLIAQTTNGIFFQAVARDNFSNPAKDRKIYVQSSIIQSTPTGNKVLTEEHQANTDATGVFSISLGNGVRVGGSASSLTTIDWSKGPFYLNLKVAITPIGGSSSWDYTKEWVDMGTTSFGAVPFALYSASSAKVDDKLNVTDTTKMLAVYAKAMSVKTLETAVASKLTAADTLTMLAPYAKAAYTIDSSFFKTQLATKLSLADSTKYVTPTQLAAKTFDTTSLSNRINIKANANDVSASLNLKADVSDVATKLSLADSTKYVTPTQLAAKTFDTTSLSNRINLKVDLSDLTTKLSLADSTKYVTPTQLAAKTFDTTSLSNRINLKATSTDVASSLALKANTTSLTAGLALKLDANQKGAANGVASLNAFGIIPSSQLPPVTLSSTNVVASDADMMALSSAAVGSIAIRTDVNKNYVLSALPASTLSNWIELLTPAAPVQTVNGYTGSVNLSKTDFDLGNVDNTSDANKPISTDVQNALNLKANISDVNTGLAQKMNTTDVNAALALKSNATEVNTALASKISTADATAALNLKLDANKVGVASGVASLNALGKVPTDQIPAISFSSVKVLSSEAEMLALSSAVIGSVVIRTDESKNYVLAQSNPAVRANWIQLLTPAAPVQTVNGMTGDISITKSSIGLENVQNTTDAGKPISTLTQNALDTKVDKETGKVLSTNDYTTAEKTKLAAITGTNTGDQDLSAYATNTALSAKAPLASPSFTGTVSAGVISATSITAPTYASAPKTLTYSGSTINWNPAQGLNAAITLTQNSRLSFTGAPPVGSYGTLVLTQDATGTRTITLPTITGVTNKVLGSTSTSTVALSTAANAKDILNFYYDGTNCYWNIGQGYGVTSTTNSGPTNLANGVSGTLSVANGGTGVTSLTGIVKGDGANAFTTAVAGTDYQRPIILTTIGTGSATLSGTTLNIPSVSSTVNAGSISGTLAVLNGGTGATTQQAAINLLTGTQSSGKYLRSDGTNATLSAIQAADIPTLNQNTTGNATTATTAGNITATSNTTLTSLSNLSTVGTITTGIWSATTIEVAKGGTGATTASAALTNLGAAPLASPTFTGTVTTGTIYTGVLSATSVNTGTITATIINTPIYASTPQTLTDASPISWNPALGLNASVTLAGNRTLSFSTAPTSGAYGTLVVKQDATGGRTLTLPSVANKVLGSSSTTTIGLSTTANAIDIVNFYFDGTNYFWNVGQGYGSASSLTAANIAGGAAGSIPYQTAAGATSLLAKGTDGQILTLASGIPSWSAAPVTGVSTATSPLSISGTTISLSTVPVTSGGTGVTTSTGTGNVVLSVSPTFSGSPVLPTGTTGVTQAAGNNSTALATTAFVTNAVKITTGLNSEETTLSASQSGATATFTLTQTPLGAKVFMYINGTRIKNGAYAVSGVTVTYTSANNNNYSLVSGDRVQFDYAY